MQTAELPVVESINDGGRPEKNLPRCESELSEMGKRYRDSSGRDHRCERRARYRVGGACLCRTHAGECLIDLLLDRRVESRPRLTPIKREADT